MSLHDPTDPRKLAAELAELTEQRDFLATYIFPVEQHWLGIKDASVEMFEELEIDIEALRQAIAGLDRARALA